MKLGSLVAIILLCVLTMDGMRNLIKIYLQIESKNWAQRSVKIETNPYTKELNSIEKLNGFFRIDPWVTDAFLPFSSRSCAGPFELRISGKSRKGMICYMSYMPRVLGSMSEGQQTTAWVSKDKVTLVSGISWSELIFADWLFITLQFVYTFLGVIIYILRRK